MRIWDILYRFKLQTRKIKREEKSISKTKVTTEAIMWFYL